jgi:hypothetical protein
MTNQVWARLSGAMGVLFVIGFIVLGALSGNSPDYKSSDKTSLPGTRATVIVRETSPASSSSP